jgi:predicted regulator of Ras-like GTPase activity (Roadblock/LC7/MglB family)
MPGASSWSFREEDFKAISEHMNGLLRESNVKSLLLVDRSGQVVANVGEPPTFDPQAFASLTAADFSANDQLAKMIGEHEFSSLFHQGEKESMYLADVAHRVILVALFDNRTTLGMVRLKVKVTVEILTKLFEDMFTRAGTESVKLEGFASKEAEDEIDKLFGD